MARADELRELLAAHFTRLGIKPPPCPLCQNTGWGVEAITTVPLYDDTPMGPSFRNQALQAIPMVCTRCGFIYSVSLGSVKQRT